MQKNIGKKIKSVLQQSGLKTVEFAQRINSTRENVYNIFERESIDTELLIKISKVLNFDFLKWLSEYSVVEENSSLVKEDQNTGYQKSDYKEKYYNCLEENNKLLKELQYKNEELQKLKQQISGTF